MPGVWVGRASGKVILFGEHAVVYGQPAIAVPVTGVQARATVAPGTPGSGVWLVCTDLPAPDGCGAAAAIHCAPRRQTTLCARP